MKPQETVNHKQHGEGIVLEITDTHYVISFNGENKRLLKAFTTFETKAKSEARKVKKISKAKRNKQDTKLSVKDIYSSIVGTRDRRHSNWMMIVDTSGIMQKADELGSFVSSVVQGAIEGKAVSEKQAWAVAYFAKDNNLI